MPFVSHVPFVVTSSPKDQQPDVNIVGLRYEINELFVIRDADASNVSTVKLPYFAQPLGRNVAEVDRIG